MAQQPSVGRIVHYQSHGSPNGQHKSAPRAAIITAVHSEVTVDLCVLNPTGMYFDRSTPFSEAPSPGCWNWPPYVAPTAATMPPMSNTLVDPASVNPETATLNKA